MTRYAENTQVSSDKSRAEIERTLVRYGASGFLYGWQLTEAVVGFTIEDRQIRFVLPLPPREDFTTTPTGKARKASQVDSEFEKAVRQRWRALALTIKAKLEAIESGIATFDQEFMAYIMLPSGNTVGSWLQPQIAEAYESGKMPKLLPAPRGKA